MTMLYDIDFQKYPDFIKNSVTNQSLYKAIEQEIRQDSAPEAEVKKILSIAHICANYASESIIKHNLATIRLASSTTPLEYLDKQNSKEVKSIKTLLTNNSAQVMFIFAVIQLILSRPKFKTYAQDLKQEFLSQI